MQAGQIRFLEKGEKPLLPAWTKLLPMNWRSRYTETCRPYRLEQQENGLMGILQVQREAAMTSAWRKAARNMLEMMEREGVSIVVPPAEGEFPRERLPFAEGRRIAALFAFEGAGEALRRQGKEPAVSSYLIAGGNKGMWKAVLASMGNEVNRLAIFTAEPEAAEEVARECYRERGLLTEVFSSPQNPALQEADVILSCGMEQRAYEHILKKGCFWLDLAGNRSVLRRLGQTRPDIAAAEGFFFRRAEIQREGRFAEAEAFLQCEAFRQSWDLPLEAAEGKLLLEELRQRGFSVSGFSALGKRVKIRKNL